MLARFGGIYCLKCFSRQDIECHHIYSVNSNPEMIYVMDNIIPLCLECHDIFHDWYGEGTPENLFEFLNLTQIGTLI